MNLSQLKMFLDVAKWGSLSEAARQQNLTQPAVTRKMQRLEKEVNADLFERGEGHHLILTSQGRDFLQYARQVLSEFVVLQEHWRTLRHEVQGNLNLVASTTPGEFVVPQLLATFVNRYPTVNPSLAIKNSEEVLNRVQARDFDAGFVGIENTRPVLQQVRISDDELVLTVGHNHRFAQEHLSEVSIKDLENQALIVREDGSGTSQTFQRILAEHNLSLPAHKVIMTLGSNQAMVNSIAAGLGIGFISLRAAEANAHNLWTVRLKEVVFKRDLYIVYEQGRDHNGPLVLREFIAFVTNRPLAHPDNAELDVSKLVLDDDEE